MKAWIGVFFVLFHCPISAQDRTESFPQPEVDPAPTYFIEVFSVLKEQMIPRLIDRLPPDERMKAADIDLVLVENPFVVSVVFTGKHTKIVYFYLGFIIGLFNYLDCLLLHWFEPDYKTESCYAYFEYYFDHILSDIPGLPQTYAETVFVYDQTIHQWYANERLNQARNLMLISALIQITMHEIGHHIVGFARLCMTVYEHRNLEERVDRWAVDRLAQMGERPMLGAMIALGYVSQMEKYKRMKGTMRFATHPMPRERAEYAYYTGCIDVADDPMEMACRMIKDVIDTFE